jgi:hypothetical protein
MTSSAAPALQIRPAGPSDAGALEQLAALDETAQLHGPVLLAFADGRPVAALSTANGRVAADPFARTADVVELLRLHSRQRSAPRRRRLARMRSARLVTA